jgi:hypothetical protein
MEWWNSCLVSHNQNAFMNFRREGSAVTYLGHTPQHNFTRPVGKGYLLEFSGTGALSINTEHLGMGRFIEHIVASNPGFNDLPAMLEFLLSSLGNSTLPDAEKERLSALVKNLPALGKDIAPESIRDILSAIDKNPLLDPARKTLLAPFGNALDPSRVIKFLESLISQEERKLLNFFDVLKSGNDTKGFGSFELLKRLESLLEQERFKSIPVLVPTFLRRGNHHKSPENLEYLKYPKDLKHKYLEDLKFLEFLGLPKLTKGFKEFMQFLRSYGGKAPNLLDDGGLFYPPDKEPYIIFNGTGVKDTYTMTVTNDAKISVKNSRGFEMWTTFPNN